MANLSEVIDWKLKQLGRLDGANVGTKDGSLVYWAVKDVEYPNQATIDLWTMEYQVDQSKPVVEKDYTLEDLILVLRKKGIVD